MYVLYNKKSMETVCIPRDTMLANAETKERRKMRLEHFFREAYALTFGLKPGEKRKLEDVTSDVIMVMRTTLSKKEFASALGMSENEMFVSKMFNIVDKDGDGRISFQEFLDTIVLFSKGTISLLLFRMPLLQRFQLRTNCFNPVFCASTLSIYFFSKDERTISCASFLTCATMTKTGL